MGITTPPPSDIRRIVDAMNVTGPLPITRRADSGRILIESVYPEVDAGRYPVKRRVGDEFNVSADIFRDGHDVIAASILYRTADEDFWRRAPLHPIDNDRWAGAIRLSRNIRYFYTIEAWTDVFASWRRDTARKIAAKQDVGIELIEGREIIERATKDLANGAARKLRDLLVRIDQEAATAPTGVLLGDELANFMAEYGPREDVSRFPRTLEVVVDRERAVFGAWYEMFPRSQGTDPNKSATFDDCIARLPEVQAMGFDVVYFVPIHPIGRLNRKGPDNTLNPGPDDPGSPYAIGSHEGGHEAIHPDLGTVEDFARLVARTRELGMEVAIDFAIQCAPDHPWVKQHPEWFVFRPDGTIKYAENPPKKYQDIVNVNFYGSHHEELWAALRDIVLLWAQRGVRIFRVDNPHTKPVPFWEWMIREVQTIYPDTIFLSEAFTRPKMMKALAKAGYTQSYTYFTWRNQKQELTEYLTELTTEECREYYRPNFFANTPDILPKFLQIGGAPAFKIRAALASMLAGVYGIYNGFELCEGRAVPNTEDYLHSEKYEYKVWDWDRPGHIKPFITQLNQIRRENVAFRDFLNLTFWRADDDNILFFSKMTPDRDNMIFVAINLDPFAAHETTLWFPIADMGGLGDNDPFEVEELLRGDTQLWRGSPHFIHLDPHSNPVAIFRVSIWQNVDYRQPGR